MAVLPARIIIFVDIPDPDNLMMAIQVLKHYPSEHVAVVLTPRVVDLSTPRYGRHIVPLIKKLAQLKNAPKPYIGRLITPITEPALWAEELPPDDQAWFSPDSDIAGPGVMEDSELYMDLTALRFARVLEQYNVKRSQYTLFWDRESLISSSLSAPSMRHAFHVHDFKYGFNERDLKAYEENNKVDHGSHIAAPNESLRFENRQSCSRYIRYAAHDLKVPVEEDDKGGFSRLSTSNTLLHPFDHLLEVNDLAGTSAQLIIGGPFTEASKYLRLAPKPEKILSMAGFISGQANIFSNQFNFHADLASAQEFLNHVESNRIPCALIPTECAKGSADSPCPFELTIKHETENASNDDFKSILGENSPLFRLISQYNDDKEKKAEYPAYDAVAALILDVPNLFSWYKVKPKISCDKGTNVIKFEKGVRASGPDEKGLVMAWNEDLDLRKPLLVETLTRILHWPG